MYMSHLLHIRRYNKPEYSDFPNYPERELSLSLLFLENMLRNIAVLHILTYPFPVCVLEALESQEVAGRAENWSTP